MSEVLLAINPIGMEDALASRTLSRVGKARTDADFAASAKKFEEMFMAQMLQPMFEGLGVNEMFGGGHGEELMRGFLVQEYGKAVSAGSGGKLADIIKSEMIKLQSQADNKAVGGII